VTRGEVESAVRSMLEIVLKRPVGADEDVARENEEAWDSVRHIELLFMLEEEFEFTFSEDEMAELNTSGEIVDQVVARTSGQ